jgi:glutathione S-transferase
MIKLYRFPLSANVERVALALGAKGIAVESVQVDPSDRTVVRAASGQDLVPVIDDDGTIVVDSMEIVRHLEKRYPDPPLYPAAPARRTEMLLFIDWFNRVWKRPPNEIFTEMGKESPDQQRIARLGQAMADYLDLFEDLLDGREHLMGDEFSAADCAAWPFLRYGLFPPQNDPHRFHHLLTDHQPLGDGHPRLAAWIRRVAGRPMA